MVHSGLCISRIFSRDQRNITVVQRVLLLSVLDDVSNQIYPFSTVMNHSSRQVFRSRLVFLHPAQFIRYAAPMAKLAPERVLTNLPADGINGQIPLDRSRIKWAYSDVVGYVIGTGRLYSETPRIYGFDLYPFAITPVQIRNKEQ